MLLAFGELSIFVSFISRLDLEKIRDKSLTLSPLALVCILASVTEPLNPLYYCFLQGLTGMRKAAGIRVPFRGRQSRHFYKISLKK